MAALGIDVSLHNGKLDWDALKAKGYQFAIVKATQTGMLDSTKTAIASRGSFVDPQFKRNQAEARRTMKRVGFYHYAHPDGGNSAKEQANFFYQTVGSLRYNEFLALDFERRDLPKAVVIQFWHEFLTELERISGRRPWVYTSASLANQYGLGQYFSKYPLWVVWYITKDKPKLPKGWNSWQVWQYTDDNGMDKNIAGANFMGPSIVDFIVPAAIIYLGLRALHKR